MTGGPKVGRGGRWCSARTPGQVRGKQCYENIILKPVIKKLLCSFDKGRPTSVQVFVALLAPVVAVFGPVWASVAGRLVMCNSRRCGETGLQSLARPVGERWWRAEQESEVAAGAVHLAANTGVKCMKYSLQWGDSNQVTHTHHIITQLSSVFHTINLLPANIDDSTNDNLPRYKWSHGLRF